MSVATRDLPTDAVRKAYGHWASVYDVLCGPIFRPAHRAAAEAANLTGGDILEVGVGTGLILPLYRTDARVRGIDVSRDMLARSADRVSTLGLRHVVGLELADIQRADGEPAAYDVIVLPFVLTLLQTPERALDNCLRLLRPDGSIIIVSHFQSRTPWIASLERRLAPLVAAIGLRPDFPLARIETWATNSGALLAETRGVGMLGVYTLLRLTHR